MFFSHQEILTPLPFSLNLYFNLRYFVKRYLILVYVETMNIRFFLGQTFLNIWACLSALFPGFNCVDFFVTTYKNLILSGWN